ncbi:alpha/beta fold hydrolase [Anaerobium acetethylicum]|uniref:Pimeloyl-ACP methyl ester carboxylesterase n=1 Tax=Anaerobium acetethylicum TaxID=1619234 RepID=A0A1D3TQI0_9FIRM|nr:alpha/beta hydrolase [Anaerobium acetethylicum]SCP95874.1 Pimeloyl-ACP methyl ester carboxylesterase [Anaerobium acetethylicum]
MKKLKKALKFVGITVPLLVAAGMVFPTWTPAIKGKNSISILEEVELGGAKQEIMIRGRDSSNPVIIYVHGGPGSPEAPYLTKYQDLLEEDFTVVNYDERGSGKSFHFFEDYSELTTELLVEDLLELTDYISRRFGKEKVILMGHSFGTYIAMQAVAREPEKYAAYIGVGQMADIRTNNQESLAYCLKMAEQAGNARDVEQMKELSDRILSGDILMPAKYIRKYKGSSRLIDYYRDYLVGFLKNPEYNLLDTVRYFSGMYVTMKAIQYDPLEKPLADLVTSAAVPCYFVMGQYDYMTSVRAARDYFDMLDAEVKEFILYEDSAHFPHFEEEERFARWMAEKFAGKTE